MRHRDPYSPFKGLAPYSDKDAQFFFGREAETELIIDNLMASRLTLLYGPSGVGKTSVLRAGVVHHLRQVAMRNWVEHGMPEHAVLVFNSWRVDPMAELVNHIQRSVAQALTGQVDASNLSRSDPTHELQRTEGLAKPLQDWTEGGGGRLFIIFDQFEEYFLHRAQEDGEGTFAVEFPRLVNNLDLRISFLISIREDALAKLDRFEGRIPNLFDNYLRIEHLDRAAAHDAIVRPIAEYNRLQATDEQPVSIENELVHEVLEQITTGHTSTAIITRREHIEAPVLQLIMTLLWDEIMRSGSRVIGLDTLQKLGGSNRILHTHLDSVMSKLKADEQEIAARIFRHLVTPSGRRSVLSAYDLAALSKLTLSEILEVLEKLSGTDARILNPIEPLSDRSDSPFYEIRHDILGPAILKWLTRYIQAQEHEEARKQNALAARHRAREQRHKQTLMALLVIILLLLICVFFLATIVLQK
jgi:hypothetical protein